MMDETLEQLIDHFVFDLQKFDDFVGKAAPVLEDSYTQAKPVMSKVRKLKIWLARMEFAASTMFLLSWLSGGTRWSWWS